MNTKSIMLYLIALLIIFSSNAIAEKIRSEVIIEKHSADIHVKLKKPKGDGPFPAVILMHGCDGLSTYVKRGINSWSKFLRKNGFVTLVVDSFTSRKKNGGKVCADYNELREARYYRTWDAFAAHKYLDKLPYVNDNIYLIGQSNGGSVAVNVAKSDKEDLANAGRRFAAVVALYPWCGTLAGDELKINVPLLVLSGEKDDWTPPKDCKRAELKLQNDMLSVITYPNAHHSFDLPIQVQRFSGHTVGRNGPALEDSKKQILSFFKKHKIQ